MWELKPGSLLGRWYARYRILGGDSHCPDMLPAGLLIRKLLIWTPLRWLFVPPGLPGIPAVVPVGITALAVYNRQAALAALAVTATPVVGHWFHSRGTLYAMLHEKPEYRYPVRVRGV